MTLLQADRADLASFLDALFRYADDGTFVSWRAFRDDAKDCPPVFIETSLIAGDRTVLIDAAERHATRAACNAEKTVFCPPIATFRNAKHAREIDLANGLALSVECDANARDALNTLERILGPVTVIVESGGVWVNPATQLPEPKLHLHWRLAEPTTAAEEHAQLKRARILATAIVGGDATNVPAVHPIRWPGSWHRKAAPRLARIVHLRAESELLLADALERLEAAAPAISPRSRAGAQGAVTSSDGPSLDALIRQILTGEAMHAPIAALAFRYLQGGMSDAQAVLTLRGVMDSVPEVHRSRPDQPDRWAGHYRDIPRAVRTAREKLVETGGAAPCPVADISQFVAPLQGVVPIAAPAVIPARLPERAEIPAMLLEPPGVLGAVARYGIESSVRPVPIFAVQAALALGSIVCARRYMTTKRNYSSLYFLNVAKSGTGKEEAKTTIERLLAAAGARRLIGGSSYSSGNAVFSALLKKPQHLTVIDEFGKYLEAASSERDSFRSDALSLLMQAFGRLHGDMATPQFSTMTLSPRAAADHEPRVIQRPAITLLAMTTPSTFYDTMRSTRVLDGFLNRFLVVEHSGPRTPMRDWTEAEIPDAAVDWIKAVLAPHGNLDVGTQAEQLPDPQLVELTGAATEAARAFERDMLALAERLERDRLGDMPIRATEIALRLSLICALAESSSQPVVTADCFDWSAQYVRFFLEQTIAALRERVADTQVERTRNQILAAIRGAGPRGVSNREIHRGRTFIGISRRDRVEVIESLIAAELVAWVDIPAGEQGGRPRRALVALEDQAGAADPAVVGSVPLDRAS